MKTVEVEFKIMKLGKLTSTNVCIYYISVVVDNDIVETEKRRLKKIDTYAILESSYKEMPII